MRAAVDCSRASHAEKSCCCDRTASCTPAHRTPWCVRQRARRSDWRFGWSGVLASLDALLRVGEASELVAQRLLVEAHGCAVVRWCARPPPSVSCEELRRRGCERYADVEDATASTRCCQACWCGVGARERPATSVPSACFWSGPGKLHVRARSRPSAQHAGSCTGSHTAAACRSAATASGTCYHTAASARVHRLIA